MMDRWMKKMERMGKNKVAAKQGWKDIISDFIIVKKVGRGGTGIHLLLGERHVTFGGSTTLV